MEYLKALFDEMIVLRADKKKSFDEIAEATGISKPTVISIFNTREGNTKKIKKIHNYLKSA